MLGDVVGGGHPSYLMSQSCFGGSVVLGGVLCWLFGKKVNAKQGGHSFFFIPVQWWGIAIVGFGIFTMVAGFQGPPANGGG
ncbi:MAG: hypothetical protein ACI8W8_001698 [Rhodothermales bacterium]|jgi:hypothetical protein